MAKKAEKPVKSEAIEETISETPVAIAVEPTETAVEAVETVVADPTLVPVVTPKYTPALSSHKNAYPESNEEFVDGDKNNTNVRILADVNAVIGKRRYKLDKGTITKLPINVYEVLKNSGKAL